MSNEVLFVLLVVVLLIWYYMHFYTKSKKLSDWYNGSKPTEETPSKTTVEVTEQFRDDIKPHLFSESGLKKML